MTTQLMETSFVLSRFFQSSSINHNHEAYQKHTLLILTMMGFLAGTALVDNCVNSYKKATPSFVTCWQINKNSSTAVERSVFHVESRQR